MCFLPTSVRPTTNVTDPTDSLPRASAFKCASRITLNVLVEFEEANQPKLQNIAFGFCSWNGRWLSLYDLCFLISLGIPLILIRSNNILGLLTASISFWDAANFYLFSRNSTQFERSTPKTKPF
ncbi:hypothetical protein CEXT_348271 [Caerostris extrusa]|uniref:Uncharacterized protein n=1 Tax=Caerostris extrusa TaxID=172846 RepID=A0AAV4URW3_CAEEX|nr:hypothetical protein CEXT_348271 [Caerostris extrusa]